MTTAKQIQNQPLFTNALKKRVLIGAGIALLMISFFVVVGGPGKPEWGPYWLIKPLLLTPFLGAIIGLCFDGTDRLRQLDSWVGRMFYVLSIVGALIGFWMALDLRFGGDDVELDVKISGHKKKSPKRSPPGTFNLNLITIDGLSRRSAANIMKLLVICQVMLCMLL